MANSDPSKTEKATDKKIQDSRKDGQVMLSQEVTKVSAMFGSLVLLILTMPRAFDVFRDIFIVTMRIDCRYSWESGEVLDAMWKGMQMLAGVLLIPMLAMMLLAAISIVAQTGPYLEAKPLTWKLDGLNPVTGFKKVLPNKENVIKLFLSVVKVGLISVIAYTSLTGLLDKIVSLPLQPVNSSFSWILDESTWLIIKVLALFIVVAIVDYALKRKQYMDKLMMSKQDIKDEMKNAEGDPMLKGRIRSKMRQLTMNALITQVPEADVVVVNPTHVAVALKYSAEDGAPRVVAKGLRKRALRIKAIAADADVPIIEEPPLARALYRKSKVGNFIPGKFFTPVAVILAKLQREKRKTFF